MKTRKSFIWEKLKSIVHTEKESVSSKTLIKSFTVNLLMDNFKGKVSCTFLQEIIMLVSLSLIRSKEGVFTDGLENSRIFIKVSLSQEKEMEEEHSGGQMEAGMKVTLKMVFNAVLVLYIVRTVHVNMRESGRMECLTARVFNTLTTDSDMKDTLRRINSMARVYSTKTTQSFTVYGKITNYQWLIW